MKGERIISNPDDIFVGTDGGATTSKTAAVRGDGTPVSLELLQRPTGGELGPERVVQGWAQAVEDFLAANGLRWEQVRGAGVAVPGPRRSYGVLHSSPNLPPSFAGFDVGALYGRALAEHAGRPIPLCVGNDANMGGVAEAHPVQQQHGGSAVMLAPGSGLGTAYVDELGRSLDGDTLAGMEAGHMPAPLHLLGVPAYPCGCGRDWGCVEVYTTLSGLGRLLEDRLPHYPEHELARDDRPLRERALALRGLAQQGDPLALELFDFQARALGLHVAALAMALDPGHFIIGGGLMEPAATTAEFRRRYLDGVRTAADPFLWRTQRDTIRIVPARLGDLSQAIGAALVALRAQR